MSGNITGIRVHFETYVDRFKGKAGQHYVVVPPEIAKMLAEKFPFRAVCTIRAGSFHCGLVKYGALGIIIQMGKATLKKVGIQEGELISVQLEPDLTEYGYEMPEEMQEALLQDELGMEAWNELTAGARRGYLHYICSGRSSDTRIKRSLEVLEKMKMRRLKK